MKIPNPIQLVQQPTDHSCVAACLSMVTGIPVDKIIKGVGEKTTTERKHHWLINHNIWPEVTFDIVLPCVYLMTVVSFNMHGLHCVVLDNRDYEFEVYDPNKGRDGKNFITLENMKWAHATRLRENCL